MLKKYKLESREFTTNIKRHSHARNKNQKSHMKTNQNPQQSKTLIQIYYPAHATTITTL